MSSSPDARGASRQSSAASSFGLVSSLIARPYEGHHRLLFAKGRPPAAYYYPAFVAGIVFECLMRRTMQDNQSRQRVGQKHFRREIPSGVDVSSAMSIKSQ
jgi:hypothetical protein